MRTTECCPAASARGIWSWRRKLRPNGGKMGMIQLNDEATARIMKRETYKNEGTCIATLQWSGDWRPAGALRGRGLSGLQ